MKKNEFINKLRFQIRKFEKEEKEEIVRYYNELIDDRLDNGEKEEKIIDSLGSVKEIVSNLVQERQNGSKVDKEGNPVLLREKRISVLKSACLIITFPLWFSLLCVVIALFVALIALVFGLAAASIAIAFVGVYYTIGSFWQFANSLNAGLVQIGCSFVLISLGVAFTYLTAKALATTTKLSGKGIMCFVRHGGILIYE